MDELGQKKSGGWKVALIALLAIAAIGYVVTKNKSTTTEPEAQNQEQQATSPSGDQAAQTGTDTAGNGIVTTTKKLDIDRPTDATADVPSGYTSSDAAVVAMMQPQKMGVDTAPVKIIEYSSLTCGHCGAFHKNNFAEFKTKFIDTGRVQITFKEFPLNEPAVNASMIMRCVPRDEYHKFMQTLFNEQDKWAYDPKYLDSLRTIAKLAGMDDKGFDACLANTELKKSIIGDMKAAADQFKVTSTPSFVFSNGAYTLVGNQPLTIFDETITKAEKGDLKSASSNLSVAPSPHDMHTMPAATAPATAPASTEAKK